MRTVTAKVGRMSMKIEDAIVYEGSTHRLFNSIAVKSMTID